MGFVSSVFSNSQGAGYQAQAAPIVTQNNTAQIAADQAQTQQGLSQEEQLGNQLEAQANGTTATPADSMLTTATNTNNANAASLLASQRGLNPALAARLASENQISNNQTSAGTLATQKANETASALNSLSSLDQGETNQTLQAQNTDQAALANQNNALVATTSNVNNADSSIANTNAKTQGGIIGGLFGGASSAGSSAASGASSAAPAAAAAAHGGRVPSLASILAKSGGKVDGKASVPGDSPKNDTVKTMLSPDEVVLPRSVTLAKDAPEKAKEFLEAIRKQGGKGTITARNGYGKVLEIQRHLHDRLARLEAAMKAGK